MSFDAAPITADQVSVETATADCLNGQTKKPEPAQVELRRVQRELRKLLRTGAPRPELHRLTDRIHELHVRALHERTDAPS